MNDTFFPSLLLHTCLLQHSFVMIIQHVWKLINCITHVMIILGTCRNKAFFLSNKFQAGMAKSAFFHVCTCCACYVAHTCFLIVVGKCRLIQFPQKQNKKSDWCWQIWLCDWATQLVKLQSFQGMLVTGVRFRFNKLVSSLIHCNQVLSHTSLP